MINRFPKIAKRNSDQSVDIHRNNRYDLSIFTRILLWSTQCRSGKPDSTLLTVLQILAVPIDLVCQDTLRIVSRPCIVVLDRSDQNFTFVVRVKGLLLDPGHAMIVDTHIQLHSELRWSFGFSSDDRPDVGLADAHNSIRHLMGLVAIHIVLLLLDLSDHVQSGSMFRTKLLAFSQKLIDVLEIPPYILELLLLHYTNHFLRTFLFLGQCQIIFSGILPIGARFRFVVFVAYRVDDRLQILSGFVQQVDILWKRDLLWCTCGIQHHGPLVLSRRRLF